MYSQLPQVVLFASVYSLKLPNVLYTPPRVKDFKHFPAPVLLSDGKGKDSDRNGRGEVARKRKKAEARK